MQPSFDKIVQGYKKFRKKYGSGDNTVMQYLANNGQQPQVAVVACCDSRVDPALLLQCDPGDLFVIRNVANIIPPYINDEYHQGTSAALEFAIQNLNVKHLIILGHSQCGGIESLINQNHSEQTDFINNWVNLIKIPENKNDDTDNYSKLALLQSYKNCLTFPWVRSRILGNKLKVHLWFFDIKGAEIYVYDHDNQKYISLDI